MSVVGGTSNVFVLGGCCGAWLGTLCISTVNRVSTSPTYDVAFNLTYNVMFYYTNVQFSHYFFLIWPALQTITVVSFHGQSFPRVSLHMMGSSKVYPISCAHQKSDFITGTWPSVFASNHPKSYYNDVPHTHGAIIGVNQYHDSSLSSTHTRNTVHLILRP